VQNWQLLQKCQTLYPSSLLEDPGGVQKQGPLMVHQQNVRFGDTRKIRSSICDPAPSQGRQFRHLKVYEIRSCQFDWTFHYLPSEHLRCGTPISTRSQVTLENKNESFCNKGRFPTSAAFFYWAMTFTLHPNHPGPGVRDLPNMWIRPVRLQESLDIVLLDDSRLAKLFPCACSESL